MTQGTNYRWVTALAAALMAGLLAAVGLPRVLSDDGAGWLLTIAVAAAVGLVVLFATRERVDEGKHVRDDALPPS